MPSSFYRFAPRNQIEVDSPTGKQYLFGTENHEGWHSLGRREFELASLFDGQRSEDEVREEFFRTHEVSLSAKDLRAFVEGLLESGLLTRSDDTLEGEARRLEPEFDRPDPAQSPPHAQAAGGRPGHESRRPRGRGAPAYPASDATFDVDELDLEGAIDITPDAFGADASETWTPAGAVRSGRQEPGESVPARDAGASSGSGWLVRIPVRGLLPLAAPLAWPSRHAVLAVLFALALAGLGWGVWNARADLVRDVLAWFDPLAVSISVAAALLTLNLLPQLARASEARRRSGIVPEFGIRRVYKVVPCFFAQTSDALRGTDPGARGAVIAAGIAAVGCIAGLAWCGWFLTREGGTTLPLVLVGIAVIATLRLLVSLDPLAHSDGYRLLALATDVPDLRERTFVTVVAPLTGRPLPPGWTAAAGPGPLLLYALAVLAYVTVILALVALTADNWLASYLGPYRVAAYVLLALVLLWEPIREARRRLDRQRARGEPEARTAGQRIWSILRLTTVAGLLVFLALLPYRYEPGGEFVLRPLQTSRTDVRSLISGRVEALPVREGDFVKSGQLLARLSGDEERKNVDATQANIRELEAQLAKAVAGATPEEVAVARQKVSSAKTRLEFSRSRAVRYEQLRNSGFTSPQEYESVLAQAESDREALAQAEKDLDQLLVGTRQEEIDSLRASIDLQKANLSYYRQQLQYTEIRAPITGYIVSGTLLTAQGNYLKNGDLFATIEDRTRLLAEIRVPQFDIGLVRIGAPIRLRAWKQPDLEIEGVVQSVAPSVEETPSGRMVRVTSELENRDGRLTSGLTGYAKVEGEEMAAGLAFTRVIVRFFQVTLWSWLP